MKRLLTILLLAALILTACSRNLERINPDETTNDIAFFDSTEKNLGETILPPVGEEYLLLTLESLEEYREVIQTHKLPSNFIFYEQLNQFGDFDSLIFCSDVIGKKDYSDYIYTLIDSIGCTFGVYINHGDLSGSNPISSEMIQFDDMRTLSEEVQGRYTMDGLEYHYLKGKLYCIEWYHDGVVYAIQYNKAFP